VTIEGVKTNELSGRRYVAAHLRGEDYTARRGGVSYSKLRAAPVDRCDHEETMCVSRECVESWGFDFRLYLPRTSYGRSLITDLGLSGEDVSRLAK